MNEKEDYYKIDDDCDKLLLHYNSDYDSDELLFNDHSYDDLDY